jgi:integrase
MKVRRRKYKSGNVAWQLDCGILNGQRVQLSFESKAEADAEMARRKAALRASGASAFLLSDAERMEFVRARERLAEVGADISQAVDFFLLHAKPGGVVMTWEELVTRCLADKEEQGLRRRYLVQLRSVGLAFGRAGHALRWASEISARDIEAWLKEGARKPRTWNSYRTGLAVFFAWGMEAGAVPLNPAKAVKRRRLDDEDIEFLTVGQCAALLNRAAEARAAVIRRDRRGAWLPVVLEEDDFRDCLAFVVIGLFCGLRPERELGVMRWEDVKLDSALVTVSAGRSKTRQRRTVDLSPNAIEWLSCVPDELRSGKLCPRNLRKRWEALRRACGLFADWPHDGLRHTFATYHYAAHSNEAKLQALMGHRSGAMLHAHYRGLASPQDAAAFWALVPGVRAEG